MKGDHIPGNQPDQAAHFSGGAPVRWGRAGRTGSSALLLLPAALSNFLTCPTGITHPCLLWQARNQLRLPGLRCTSLYNQPGRCSAEKTAQSSAATGEDSFCMRQVKPGKASPTLAPHLQALPWGKGGHLAPYTKTAHRFARAPIEAQAALPGCKSRATLSSHGRPPRQLMACALNHFHTVGN